MLTRARSQALLTQIMKNNLLISFLPAYNQRRFKWKAEGQGIEPSAGLAHFRVFKTHSQPLRYPSDFKCRVQAPAPRAALLLLTKITLLTLVGL